MAILHCEIIKDKSGHNYKVCLEKISDTIILKLSSSALQNFVIGSVTINRKNKVANINDINLKRDFSALDFLGLNLGEIDLSHRGLGIQIVRLLEIYLKNLGMKRIVGEVSVRDKGAEIFWRKCGYKIRPYKEGNIIFLIEKRLE